VRSSFLRNEVPVTFRDHPGVQSALLYTKINLCNLNCYKCHNRRFFKGKEEFFTFEELGEKLEMLKLLGVELLIISGGEPTLEPELERSLDFIKAYSFPVRLDTNGTRPERVESLIREGLIDGVALDVKIPLLDEYTPDQLQRFKRVLFSSTSVRESSVFEYSNLVRRTIEIIKKYSLPYTLLRTVEYPLLTEEDKRLIKTELKSLPHQFNPFFDPEE